MFNLVQTCYVFNDTFAVVTIILVHFQPIYCSESINNAISTDKKDIHIVIMDILYRSI